MPWFLYLAFKQLFPSGRRFPFFTFISVVGVALGVALLVVVTSVMGGFGHEIRRMIVDTEGEIQIKASGYVSDSPELLKKISTVPGVEAATPYAAGALMIEYHGKPTFPAMRGIDLATVEKVVQLGKYIRVGSLDDLDDDSVILSSQLAQSIGASVGSKIEVYSPLIIERFKNDEVFMPREVRVAGIIEIGHQQLDSSTVYCTLRLAQDLYGLGSAVHGINVRVKPGQDEDDVAARLNVALPPGIRAYSWMSSFADFLWVLHMEKSMMLFILMFVVLVAAFMVTSLLLVLVLKKTREIGLLGALGAKRSQIAWCFCAQGVFIGVCGVLSGLALGYTLLHFRNEAVAFLSRLAGNDNIFSQYYQLSKLPAYTETSDLVIIIVGSLVLSTLAGILPAIIAARLKPVEALRSE